MELGDYGLHHQAATLEGLNGGVAGGSDEVCSRQLQPRSWVVSGMPSLTQRDYSWET